MIRIAICEDDNQQQDTIKQYVREHREYDPSMEIFVFSSGEELLSAYAEGEQYDFLFLDIQMKEINGIEVAQEIRKSNDNIIIFFTTGFTEYISEAFAVDAFQFLHKPIRQELFHREFSRALKKYYTQSKCYMIDEKSKVVSLELKEIFCLEVLGRQIIIHTTSGTYEKTGKMETEEFLLQPYGFVRVHRAYLVNMEHIVALNKDTVTLRNQIEVTMSPRRRTEVLNQYNQFRAGSL